MIGTTLVTRDDLQIAVVLAAPNWTSPITITYRQETEIQTGGTGIEDRAIDSASPRLKISYTATLLDGDWQTFETARRSVGETRIGLPLWVDALPRDMWDNRVHDAGLIVGWNEGLKDIEVGSATSLPAGEYLAPLVVGRVAHKDQQALTNIAGHVPIELSEDRSWRWRVLPAGVDGQFDFVPDWVGDVQQVTRDYLKYETLGKGALQMVDGDPLTLTSQTARYTLERADARRMLAHWWARRGEYQSFTWQSPITPGVETPFAPHLFDGADGKGHMRYQGQELSFTWQSYEIAQTSPTFWQIVDTPTHEQERPTYAMLYHFWRDADPHFPDEEPAIHEYVTNWEMPVATELAALEDGQQRIVVNEENAALVTPGPGSTIWQPVNIDGASLKQDVDVQKDDFEIESELGALKLLEPAARGGIDFSLWCEALRYNLQTGEVWSLVLGKVRARCKGRKVIANVSSFGKALGRIVPSMDRCRSCPYVVFQGGCIRGATGKPNPGHMAKRLWRAKGTYHSSAVDTTGIKLHLTDCQMPSSFTNYIAAHPEQAGGGIENWHYYVDGAAEIGHQLTRQRKPIIFSAYDAQTNSMDLILKEPFTGLEPGDEIRFFPGCDGAYKTCREKFSNGHRIGAWPYIPAYLDQPQTSSGGRGK